MTEYFAHITKGNGPGLLLAHGAGGGVEANFGPVLDDLAATHTVVGADYPGSGRTPRAEGPLDLDELADTLVDTAVAAGVERFTVLGYSLGTAVAVRAAARHPERVTALVLTAGFARLDNRSRLAVDVWRALLDGDPRLTARYLTLAAAGDAFLNALDPAVLEGAVEALAASLPEGSREQADLAAAVDTRADLPGIRVPTLVVAATRDALVSPDLSRELAEHIPGARLVEIAAGHSVATEARDEWLAAVRDFLADVG
ncbi:alpha/beta fold hydrolase [Thermobifida halotolerans]|uniref:Alpha/beta fold hydrolase n=1 Tax=Thermobifida halotolerans TaxID=483545 RepID=A0A399G4L6_9ACTN|nr:alpha/beta fold hydrolase [Thermobifida halotolerans]UOE20782.1 alpha/beta fold hydrolase [Thermobifida halotolerans]